MLQAPLRYQGGIQRLRRGMKSGAISVADKLEDNAIIGPDGCL